MFGFGRKKNHPQPAVDPAETLRQLISEMEKQQDEVRQGTRKPGLNDEAIRFAQELGTKDAYDIHVSYRNMSRSGFEASFDAITNNSILSLTKYGKNNNFAIFQGWHISVVYFRALDLETRRLKQNDQVR